MNKHPILYSLLIIFFIFVVFAGLIFTVFMVTTNDDKGSLLSFGDIAVVKIEGPIMDSTDTIEKFHRLAKNKSIKAVVVRIDSPGGGVAASQEIYEELKKLKPDKKIVVSMGALAASGGYYVAIAGDKILAQPGTVTGSIGVISESFGLQEIVKWAKLERRTFKSGPLKDVGDPFREQNEEDKVLLQGLIDNMYGQFKGVVMKERHFTPEKMDEVGGGRVFTGEQALALGLIDGLGTIYDAIEESKKLAGLPEDARVNWPEEDDDSFGFFDGASHFLGDIAEKTIQKLVYSSAAPAAYYLPKP